MTAENKENPYAGLRYYFATQNPLQPDPDYLTSTLQFNTPQQTASMTGNTGVIRAPSTTPKGFNYSVAASSAKTQYDVSVAAAEKQRDDEIKAINEDYDSQLSVLDTNAKGAAEAARLEEQRNKKIEKAKASCENKKKKAGKTFQSTMNTVKTWGGLKDEDIQKDENLKAAFDEYKKQTEPQQTEEQTGAESSAESTSDSSGGTSSSGSGTSTTDGTTTTDGKKKEGEKKGKAGLSAEDTNLAEGTAELVGSGIGEGVFSSIAKWSKEKSGMGKQGDPMGRDAHLNRQAEMHDNESAEHRMDQQRWSQIANQDPRREAGKDALAKAAVQNEQKVHNMGNASAGAAALERGEADADPNALRNRGDQARMKATENMEKANDENQTAEQERAGADVYGYTARDMETSNAQAKAITDGGAADGETETETEEKEKPKDKEEVKEEETPQVSPQSWQAYINYICYGNDPTSRNSEQSKTFDPKIRELAKPLIDKYGLEPIKPSDLAAKYPKGSKEYNVLFGSGSTNQFADWTGNGNMRARQQSILQSVMEDMYKDSPMIKDWRASESHFDANGNQVNRAEGVVLSEEQKKAEEQKKMINDVTSKSEVPQ